MSSHNSKTLVRNRTMNQPSNHPQPEEVAKTIVQAILSQKPEFRYVVGSDAVTLMQARKNMPYSDFQQMIQKILDHSADGQTSIDNLKSMHHNYYFPNVSITKEIVKHIYYKIWTLFWNPVSR